MMNPASALPKFRLLQLPTEVLDQVLNQLPFEPLTFGRLARTCSSLNLATRPHREFLLKEIGVASFFAAARGPAPGNSKGFGDLLKGLLQVNLPAFVIGPRIVSWSRGLSRLSAGEAAEGMHAIFSQAHLLPGFAADLKQISMTGALEALHQAHERDEDLPAFNPANDQEARLAASYYAEKSAWCGRSLHELENLVLAFQWSAYEHDAVKRDPLIANVAWEIGEFLTECNWNLHYGEQKGADLAKLLRSFLKEAVLRIPGEAPQTQARLLAAAAKLQELEPEVSSQLTHMAELLLSQSDEVLRPCWGFVAGGLLRMAKYPGHEGLKEQLVARAEGFGLEFRQEALEALPR